MSKSERQSIPYRIVILGDNTVGKTSFFNKVIDGKFQENYLSTIGMDRRTISQVIKDKEGKDLTVTISLWDTAGQERFRGLSLGYVQNADGIILMFDIENKCSFYNLKNWINDIEKHMKNSNEIYAIKIIGNKEDLRDANSQMKQVTTEDVKEEFKETSASFEGFYSAKTDTKETLEIILNKIGQEIYDKIGVKINKEVNELNEGNNKPKKKRMC